MKVSGRKAGGTQQSTRDDRKQRQSELRAALMRAKVGDIGECEVCFRHVLTRELRPQCGSMQKTIRLCLICDLQMIDADGSTPADRGYEAAWSKKHNRLYYFHREKKVATFEHPLKDRRDWEQRADPTR